MTAGGRRFQDEAARYENARRDAERRKPGGSSIPARVDRVSRCETVARATNNERIASGVRGSCSALKTRRQSRRLTSSSTPRHLSALRVGEIWSLARIPDTTLSPKLITLCTLGI